jgi:hypothetical protein
VNKNLSGVAASINELACLFDLASETRIGISQSQSQVDEVLAKIARQLRGAVDDVRNAFTLQRWQIASVLKVTQKQRWHYPPHVRSFVAERECSAALGA